MGLKARPDEELREVGDGGGINGTGSGAELVRERNAKLGASLGKSKERITGIAADGTLHGAADLVLSAPPVTDQVTDVIIRAFASVTMGKDKLWRHGRIAQPAVVVAAFAR